MGPRPTRLWARRFGAGLEAESVGVHGLAACPLTVAAAFGAANTSGQPLRSSRLGPVGLAGAATPST
jgi:hypothetical protein